jgi:hypothetical protein
MKKLLLITAVLLLSCNSNLTQLSSVVLNAKIEAAEAGIEAVEACETSGDALQLPEGTRWCTNAEIAVLQANIELARKSALGAVSQNELITAANELDRAITRFNLFTQIVPRKQLEAQADLAALFDDSSRNTYDSEACPNVFTVSPNLLSTQRTTATGGKVLMEPIITVKGYKADNTTMDVSAYAGFKFKYKANGEVTLYLRDTGSQNGDIGFGWTFITTLPATTSEKAGEGAPDDGWSEDRYFSFSDFNTIRSGWNAAAGQEGQSAFNPRYWVALQAWIYNAARDSSGGQEFDIKDFAFYKLVSE